MNEFQPSLIEARELSRCSLKDSLLPVCISTPCDLQSPSAIFLKLGAGYDHDGDPLRALQSELAEPTVDIPGMNLPNLIGGAVGYLSYDCIEKFEPITSAPWLKDNLQIPEAMFMMFDTIVAFDHFKS